MAVIFISLLTPPASKGDDFLNAERRIDSITAISSGLTLRRLKSMADSLHMSDNHNAKREAQSWYMAAMERTAKGMSEKDWEIMAGIHSNYASYLYYNDNNSVLAFPHLLKAISIEKELCDSSFALCSAYVTLGRLYANYNNKEKAISILKKGLRRNLHSRKPEKANYSFANLLMVAWSTRSLDSITHEIAAIPRSHKSSAPLKQYNILLAKATAEYLRHDLEKAASLLQQALGVMDSEFAPMSYLTATNLMLAATYLDKGQPKDARTYIDAAGRLADIGEDTDFYLHDWHDALLERYHRISGNPSMADHVNYIILRRRDSLYNSRNQTLINDLEQQHITSALSAHIRIEEEHRQYLEMEYRAQKRILWIVSAGSCIIIALLLWLLSKRRRLRQCNRVLFEKNIESIATEPHPAKPDEPTPCKKQESEKENDEGQHSDCASEESLARMKSIYEMLTEFCKSRKEIFDPNFSIDTMSSLTGLKSRNISQAVNSMAEKNFSNFIAEFRIKEACRILLEHDRKSRPSLESLAETVGFRSRPHFSNVFKTVTGMTCTEFMRQADRQK